MPFKDKEKEKEYRRQWYLRKKIGSPTRLYKPFTEEERKEGRRIARNKYYYKQREKMEKLLGKQCVVCSGLTNLCCHKIDLAEHKKPSNDGFKDVIKNPETYLRLCYACHKGIHFAIEYLNLSWEYIKSQLSI